MKLKFIACAVAAVCAQSAFALDFATTAQIQAGTLANSHVVYLSGASALKNSVPLALAKLCSDAVTTFTYSGDSGNVKAYSCTIKTAAALLAEGVTLQAGWPGSKVLMGLSVQGGAFTSVVSQQPDPSALLSDGTAEQNQQVDFTGVNTSGSVNKAFRKQTIGGFSDVNTAMFDDIVGLNPNLAAVAAGSSSIPVAAGQSFGIAVSPSLYAALQGVQGLLPACAGLRTVACQPNITKGQYASMIAVANAGAITDWSILGLTSAADNLQPVNICRRVPTSGTQAASNLFFLGKGCSTGGQEPAKAVDSSSTYIVTEGSGTANVVTCVSNASNYAMGVVSAENATAGSAWAFVKVDGVAINDTNEATPGKARQTAIDQKYNFTYEFVIASRNSASQGEKDFLAGLGIVIANPAVTNLVGIYTVPGTYDNATFPTQVAKATSGGNVCQSPTTFF